MDLTGAPKTIVQAVDASLLPSSQRKGIYLIPIATERGEPSKAVLVTSWIDFTRKFGSFIPSLAGTYELKKALDRGAKAYVSRVAHYTNVADKSTLVGSKSTGTKTVTAVAETRATSNEVVTAAGTTGNTIEFVVNDGTNIVSLGSYAVLVTDTTPTLVATGIRAAINTGTGTHGYSAAGTGANVIITAPVGSGSGANSYVVGVNVTGTVTATTGAFTGGVTAILAGDAGVSVWNGKFIGAAYAGAIITVAPARSGDTSKIDVTFSLPGYDDQTTTVREINRVPAAGDVLKLNNNNPFVDFISFTTRIPYGSVALTGGAYDTTLLTDTDYVGSNVGKTGLYAFGDAVGAYRIANLERPVPVVDAAFVAFADARNTMRAILKFPLDLTFDQANDYRLGTGSYSHSPIDSWRGTYIYGDLIYSNPADLSIDQNLSGIGDTLGLRAKTDSQNGEWISHAGPNRGKIDQNKGLLRNIGSADDQGSFDTQYDNGINAIIKHETYGVCYWGNNTLLRDRSKLLAQENIAELMIYILWNLKAKADKILFNPNDPSSWNQLYRDAKTFITTLEDGRAIEKGEGLNWFWIGDQDADTIQDVKFNQASDIQLGKYKARFVFLPIGAITGIYIEATATSLNNLQFAVVENPL